jgi:hypothetical protein
VMLSSRRRRSYSVVAEFAATPHALAARCQLSAIWNLASQIKRSVESLLRFSSRGKRS